MVRHLMECEVVQQDGKVLNTEAEITRAEELPEETPEKENAAEKAAESVGKVDITIENPPVTIRFDRGELLKLLKFMETKSI